MASVKKGTLIPLGNGFSYVLGNNPNKIDDVDIGPNNKNGLSVNNGEIIQNKGNTIRVFSAEPMFNGISPTSLLYGGANPDKVFAMQEQWKKTHRVKDDGTRYKSGGEKYKTKLTDEEEKEFQKWYKLYADATGNSLNPDDKEHYYDYRGYWKNVESNPGRLLLQDYAGDFSKMINAENVHLPDTYKIPGHPTFSDESKYADDEHPGGHWEEDKYYTEEEMRVPRLGHIFSDYVTRYQSIINGWDTKTISNNLFNNDSNLITFKNSNTNISKFLDNKSLSKDQLKAVYDYSKKFNLNPYSIAAGLLYEDNPYTYNTHSYTEKQIPSRLKLPKSELFGNDFRYDTDEAIDIFIKNIGLEGSGKENNIKAIKERINYILGEVQKIADADTITTSIGRYAKMIHDYGFGAMNPKQKGWTSPITGKTVKHSYQEMIDSASESLRKNYPNLFNEQEHKQFGGTMNKRKKALDGEQADAIGAIASGVANTMGLVNNLVFTSKRKTPVYKTPMLKNLRLVDNVRPYVDNIKEYASKLYTLNDLTSASSRSRFSRANYIGNNRAMLEGEVINRANLDSMDRTNQSIAQNINIDNQNIQNAIAMYNKNILQGAQDRNQQLEDYNASIAQFSNNMDSILNGENGLIAKQKTRASELRNLSATLLANPYAREALEKGEFDKVYNILKNIKI